MVSCESSEKGQSISIMTHLGEGGRKPDSQFLRMEWETDVKETSSLAVRERRKGRKLREP